MEHTYKDMNRRHRTYEKLLTVSESDLQAAAIMVQELGHQVAILEETAKQNMKSMRILEERATDGEKARTHMEQSLSMELSMLENQSTPLMNSTDHARQLDMG
eukprot:Clim_evm33s158 gene=Clim_evmTU33s158